MAGSFNPFLNSITVPTLGLFTRQQRQTTASEPPPAFNPFLNSILPSNPPANPPIRHPRQQRQWSPSQPPPAFNPFSNSILPPANPHPKRANPSSANPPSLKVKKQRTAEDPRALEAVKFAISLLEEEFEQREAASEAFPLEISSTHIRTAISKYEDEISAVSERSICCSCGSFVATGDIYKIDDEDDFMLPLQGSLDDCGHYENTWGFCTSCYTALRHCAIPKFSAKNLVNVTMCQYYPAALEDLTVVEECLIAKCHPIGTILKLRPGGRPSPASYNALRGHMIVIPQDPGPLLRILPSPELKLDNLIKVFWLGKHPPTNRDLKPFLQVRKDKVLAALQYLVQHNHLYHDLAINYTMIDSWADNFIPPEITENITCLGKPDHHEREGYTVSLRSGNYENDLHAAQDGVFHTEDEPFTTGSVYTDINGERANPDIQMIDALLGVITSNSHQADERVPAVDDTSDEQHQQRDIPTISYAIRGQATLMNSWEDPHYFTGAFPTLLPTGIGGHKHQDRDQRPVALSLAAFAQWALNHHSRRLVNSIKCYKALTFHRFARHK